ncbi:hypothetical protein A3I46_03345 [Candidatus Kaiserbacteria bacterium RIFCSPLOWO2_02_FULL_54_13]|uniref:UDP-N-acetylglucosamine kinase n=1 Tax=Candidatus Kaiserbacteria bacterium RIFCSPHIGHO2_02_FULL_54_22 TaxID=1798495 RepID=A0A1F6DME9_9BACT|nr:MAG: hypothetical protein UY91_C0034G0011 [Parcubacteria group bacterium GW2011_GWB1_55_9]OGG62564.1 MAG: hypothetical protein A3C19_01105 [Candidatus Kaiserbacteria bacterium RIFCSPHIGHO2_02_FULL_54_22]OGG68155.1 MAG: hypothetical protein A3E99_03130 [Candidatus Kaiserbacteria bacterium RIFCSPHIGHO2_12_FULL_54_16]OGG82506.1 MAG: hypothetical protein A3I46_03345 [Candidatus Kaiserbacteria bacterium RIFCSPLOWO2_02_FULL_54_13]OGG89822.1 MAG: hypothetical protein A3G12_01960 [Candidatus Kaiserb
MDNKVYLLVGQRGSGKNFYAEKLLSHQPDLMLISRDAILVERFGSTDTCPYGGAQHFAVEETKRLLKEALSVGKGSRIILDYWTEDSRSRGSLIRYLRQSGASQVNALYFITSLDLVNEWFWKKPGIAKMSQMRTLQDQGFTFFSEDAPVRDYAAFHELAANIDSDGFDTVTRINPVESVIRI